MNEILVLYSTEQEWLAVFTSGPGMRNRVEYTKLLTKEITLNLPFFKIILFLPKLFKTTLFSQLPPISILFI